MWKKITISLFALILIFSISTAGYAASTNKVNPNAAKVDVSKYQVNTPKENSSASKKKVVLVSGKAPEGTSVVIKVYGAVDLTGKNYTLAKLPKEDDYVIIPDSCKTVKSGPAGFGEEIELIMGINKVIVNFNVDGVPPVEKIIYYYEAEQLEKAINSPTRLPSVK